MSRSRTLPSTRPAAGRQVGSLYGKLVCHNTGPVGTKYGTGIPDRLCGNATPRVTANSSTLYLGAGHTNTGGNIQTPTETGDTTCGVPLGEGLLLKHISGTQKGWGAKTRHQPQSAKQLCSPRALQDGGNSHPEGPSGAGRLAGKDRPEGRILCNSDTPITSEIPAVSIPRENLPLHLPSLWTLLRPMGVHKDSETSPGCVTPERDSDDCLHRRHTPYSRVQGASSGSVSSCSIPTRVSGIHHQHREICAHPRSDHRVLGSHSQLHQYGATTSSCQDKTDSSRVSTDNEDGRANLSPNTSTPIGQNEFNNMRNSLFYRNLQMALSNALETNSQDYKGTLILSPASLEELKWWNTEMFKWNGKTLLKREIDMIIDSDASLQGWGARCGIQTTRGAWSQKEVTLHINCLELLAATLAVQSFAKNKSKLNILLRIDNTTAVAYINHLGGTVSRDLVNLTKDLWMWCLERNIHITAQHLPGIQNTIADAESRAQMDRTDWKLSPPIFHKIQENFWSTGSGSLCDSSVCPVPTLLQLAARSICRSNRRISPSVDPHQGVCQPTMESDRPDTFSGPDSTSQHSAGSTSVEIPTMVSHTPIHVGGLSQTNNNRNRDNGQQGQLTDAPTTSRMAYLRERYRGQQLSEEATELMLNSWRTKTNKSYDSLFTKWHCWCSEQSSDPFRSPIAQVANFLAYLYKEGYQYSSVNAYRSAISSVHEKIDGYTVGQHPLVCRLVKGVFHARPPLPRYSQTWDVQKVLNYIDTLGDNQTLSLKHLSWKVTMLLALSRPSRSADLSKLDISKRVYNPDGVCFYPSTLAKQSRSTSQITNFFFPFLPGGSRLCPVSTLKEYESRTQPLPERETKLLVAIIKPHKAVSSSTVARWLKSLLEVSGIDTSIFGAHSVRGASSSAVASAGVSTSDILKAAGWSSESTFQRFYYRPTDNTSFGRAVLSQHSQPATNNTVDM